MKLLFILFLSLFFQLIAKKETNSEEYIIFQNLGSIKECDTYNERFIFNILADHSIKEGKTFNLHLKTPNYTSAVCEIKVEDILCAIDVTNYLLEYLTLELESDIHYIPFEYEGWEKVNKVIYKDAYCL